MSSRERTALSDSAAWCVLKQVNFNDWMVGGDVLEGNLLANCVREVR